MTAQALIAVLQVLDPDLEVARADFAHGACQIRGCAVRYRLPMESAGQPTFSPGHAIHRDVPADTPGAVAYILIR